MHDPSNRKTMKLLGRFSHLLLLPLWLAGLYWAGASLQADRHFQRAREYVDNPARHVEELNAALKLNPWHGMAQADMGRVMTAREDWMGTIAWTRRALQDVFFLDLQRQLANAYYQLWDKARLSKKMIMYAESFNRVAAEQYSNILLFLPDDRDSLYRLAQLDLISDPAKSIALARRSLLIYPPASDTNYLLNMALAQEMEHVSNERLRTDWSVRGDYREAMHATHRAVLLGPSQNLGPEVFQRADFKDHLKQWDMWIRNVEAGELRPEAAVNLETNRGRGVRPAQ